MKKRRKRKPAQFYIDGICQGQRFVLSQAITLIESNHPEDFTLAQEILEGVLPSAGKSLRIGITGVPGVGKSTFIEAFGFQALEAGRKLAVLAIDPTSPQSGGSILGDKTRMEKLTQHPDAFIRPSPAGESLGGVARRTREAMLLCEAAGYDLIFVETVGVGQSETQVRGMVDFFLLLMLAGAGDELQGIKRGIMEMADALVINKADGENAQPARRAKAEYRAALHLFPMAASGVLPAVKTCSALHKEGLGDIWDFIAHFYEKTQENGWFTKNRNAQQLRWFEEHLRSRLQERFFAQEGVKENFKAEQSRILAGERSPTAAAEELLELF